MFWQYNLTQCLHTFLIEAAYMKGYFFFLLALTCLSSVEGQCSSSGTTLTGSSGSFSSPNYPSNYPNGETCRWIITVPTGHLVRLSFQSFQLESCAFPSPICSCDHLEVRDGTTGSSKRLGRYCGNEYPAAVQSSGRSMWIEFDSDLFSNEQGFSATYTAVGMFFAIICMTLQHIFKVKIFNSVFWNLVCVGPPPLPPVD